MRCPGRERGHRLPQPARALTRDQRGQRGGRGGRLRREFEGRTFAPHHPAVMAHPVLRQTHRNGGQPRVERALIVVTVNVRVGAHEGVLSDFFRASWLAHHHQHQTKQPPLVALHERTAE